MNRIQWAMALVLLTATAGCGGGSEAAEAPEGETSTSREGEGGSEAPALSSAIPAGTQLIFVVEETISTEENESGHVFPLRLVGGVSAESGAQLPEGTRARGVITSARSSTDSDSPAQLVVALSSIELNGRWVPVNSAVLQAQVSADAGDSSARTAAKVGTGAAAGAIIGQILGQDTRSTVTGAVVGTVAGGAIAAATRTGHAVLPAGSQMTVRLDEPINLR